jgi:hypothetical protein
MVKDEELMNVERERMTRMKFSIPFAANTGELRRPVQLRDPGTHFETVIWEGEAPAEP